MISRALRTFFAGSTLIGHVRTVYVCGLVVGVMVAGIGVRF